MATAIADVAIRLMPLADKLVVRPNTREEVTSSGIVLPDTAQERPQQGTVLAAGPGHLLEDGSREPMEVSPGQKVLFAKYAGAEFKLNDEDLLILAQKDVLAILVEPGTEG